MYRCVVCGEPIKMLAPRHNEEDGSDALVYVTVDGGEIELCYGGQHRPERQEHFDGEPGCCSETCDGPHWGEWIDATEACETCGGNAYGCYLADDHQGWE
jgi:hypothetical protein